MKVAVLFALIALASAGQVYQGPGVIGGGHGYAGSFGYSGGLGYGGGIVNTGSSSSTRKEDGLGNYHFAYQEQGTTGGSARDETGSAGRVQGSYTLNVGDGRQRTVNYVADEFGYRAQIQTNEPGTAPLAGADTTISAPDTVGIAAATNQRTAEQLHALANAPPEVPEVIAAPRIAAVAPRIAAAPVAIPQYHQSYAAAAPISYSNSVSHIAAPAIASSIHGGYAGYGAHLSHGIAAPAIGYGSAGYGSAGLGFGYGAGFGARYGAAYGGSHGGHHGAGYGTQIIHTAPATAAIGYNAAPAYGAAYSGVKGAW